jgi:ribosome-associated heat shock protein Hsp15
LAQGWAEAGHIRIDGRRIEKGSATVKIGNVVTLPRGDAVLAIKLLALPLHRGPAAEAQLCYQLLE